jgi:hypothetical protein
MSYVASYLARLGWLLRTGGAGGSDWAFETGAVRVLGEGPVPGIEVFLPWAGFSNRLDISDDRIINGMGNREAAKHIAKMIHPAGGNLKESHLLLHGRNAYQVLGPNLDDPSDFIVYYAVPDGQGSVKGGTRTAVEIARRLGVAEINLYYDDIARDLFELVKACHPDPLGQCYKNYKVKEFSYWLNGNKEPLYA